MGEGEEAREQSGVGGGCRKEGGWRKGRNEGTEEQVMEVGWLFGWLLGGLVCDGAGVAEKEVARWVRGSEGR